MNAAQLHVLLAGGSGFLGTELTRELRERGHRVTRLVRRPVKEHDESQWDPYSRYVDPVRVEAAEVVINLAGSSLVGNPHSAKWRSELERSRVVTTQVLAEAIARQARDGARAPAFLAGNGISFYGDRSDVGDPVLTEEDDSRGDALLTQVTRVWQEAANPAVAAGARVAFLRTAPVMDRTSPPLKQLIPLFRLYGGAKLGSGHQHMAMISLRDWVAAVSFLAEHDDASGPFNLCLPRTPTNAEFTEALANGLHRKAFLAVPKFVLDRVAGALAPEILGSLNVRPAALEALGFEFEDPDVISTVDAALAARR